MSRPDFDVRRDVAAYRARRGRIDDVVVPPLLLLSVEGRGDPNTAASYREALAALYPMAYRLKFRGRHLHGRDARISPLQARWWAPDPTVFTTARDKDRWHWTVSLAIPDWEGAADVEEVRAELAARPAAPPALERVRLERFAEGRCLQTLHVGPYDDEGPVLAHLHDVELPARGLERNGHHHEVYLTDARRTAPERLRTILRQPVRPLGSTGP